MTWLKSLNPTPSFPEYTGPYKVGSVDVEIPAKDLENPAAPESPSPDVATVSFRLFYPTKADSEQKAVKWIPEPQKEVVSAYARFLGAGNGMAGLFA